MNNPGWHADLRWEVPLLWLVLDVVLGLVLAGIVLPLTVVLVPPGLRGRGLAMVASLAAIALASLLRRRVVGGGRSR